jgi:hypothetical protein
LCALQSIGLQPDRFLYSIVFGASVKSSGKDVNRLLGVFKQLRDAGAGVFTDNIPFNQLMDKFIAANYPTGVVDTLQLLFDRRLTPDGVTIRTLLKGMLIFSNQSPLSEWDSPAISHNISTNLDVVRSSGLRLQALPHLVAALEMGYATPASNWPGHVDKVLKVCSPSSLTSCETITICGVCLACVSVGSPSAGHPP